MFLSHLLMHHVGITLLIKTNNNKLQKVLIYKISKVNLIKIKCHAEFEIFSATYKFIMKKERLGLKFMLVPHVSAF